MATPVVALIVDVPAAHASETYQRIVASHSDKCLNVPYASQSDGVQLIQYTCPSTATNDRWIFEPVHVSGIEAYRIRAMHSKKCLNVSGASQANGAPVIQYTCIGGYHPNELWFVVPADPFGQLNIQAVHSGKCLNVAGASTANGAKVIQYTCVPPGSGVGNDRWYLPDIFITPARTNGYKPVLFLHGYANDGSDSCSSTWKAAVDDYDNWGYDRFLLKTVKYYTSDSGCDLDATRGLFANQNTHIQELARRFAWMVWTDYSQFGVAVDAVGFSMGGLIIRAAITGTRYPPSGAWPPYLYIEDVSTLGTPHDGSAGWGWAPGDDCPGVWDNTQCHEMRPGAAFIEWLQARPNVQANSGTDWSLIGSGDDGHFLCCVRSDSALDVHASVHAGHKYLYLSGQGLDHGDLPRVVSGTYNQRYCHYYNSCDRGDTDFSSWPLATTTNTPIMTAKFANYYSSKY